MELELLKRYLDRQLKMASSVKTLKDGCLNRGLGAVTYARMLGLDSVMLDVLYRNFKNKLDEL